MIKLSREATSNRLDGAGGSKTGAFFKTATTRVTRINCGNPILETSGANAPISAPTIAAWLKTQFIRRDTARVVADADAPLDFGQARGAFW